MTLTRRLICLHLHQDHQIGSYSSCSSTQEAVIYDEKAHTVNFGYGLLLAAGTTEFQLTLPDEVQAVGATSVAG
jgi:hypothetical protein